LLWLRQGLVDGVGTFDELQRRDAEFRAMAALAMA
jgi:hypothetical protein